MPTELKPRLLAESKCPGQKKTSLEQSDATLKIVPSPEWQRVELVSVHVEGHLEVGVGQVLLEVAAVDVRRKFVVAGEEKVQRIGFVIRYRSRSHGGVIRPERMGGHHVEAKIKITTRTIQISCEVVQEG
jgi:hypothetical protein